MDMNILQKPHVVMVPFPAMGHCIPFLDLAKLLAAHSLTISYVTTRAIARRLQAPVDESRQAADLDINLIGLSSPNAIEGLPEGRESADLIPTKSMLSILSLVENLREPFDCWVQQQGCHRPMCIISDMFIDGTVQSAERFHIPRVVFATCGAFGTSVFHAICDSMFNNTMQKEGDCVIVENILSSAMKFTKDQIPAKYSNPDHDDPGIKFVIGKMQSLSKCWGMLVNTFDGLESRYLEHCKDIISGKPLWSVGPVLPSGRTAITRGKSADIGDTKLLQWLDSQSLRTVVYVSFGSQAFLSQEQIMALAKGLEASEQAFIWSIKLSPEAASSTPGNTMDFYRAYLPEGFMDRAKGLVIWGWAPQLVILSHPSVGAFMSHCGWNSTLESISMGVPLVTWPMFGDQHFNSKFVTEELLIGVQFCQHRDEIPCEKKVEKCIRLLLSSEEGKKMRKRAENLKEMAAKSVGENGSSTSNLQAFVNEMHKLVHNCTTEDINGGEGYPADMLTVSTATMNI